MGVVTVPISTTSMPEVVSPRTTADRMRGVESLTSPPTETRSTALSLSQAP